MTDSPVTRPSAAGPDARARAMDEALDWLVRLQCATDADTLAFEQWLSAAPENAEAYVEAEALWNGTPLRQAATQMHHGLARPVEP